jgi:membrane protein
LLFFVVSIFGLVAHNNPQFRMQLMNYVRTMLPPDASSLLSRTLEQILQASSGTKLTLGLLAALWTGSSGMAAVMDMCNITYDVKEGRPYWKSRGLTILLTVVCSILVVASLALILYGPSIADAVFGNSPVVAWTWKIASPSFLMAAR